MITWRNNKNKLGVLLSYIAVKDELPKSAWLVSKMGRVTAGVQFEPQSKNYTYFIPL